MLFCMLSYIIYENIDINFKIYLFCHDYNLWNAEISTYIDCGITFWQQNISKNGYNEI